MSPWALDWQTIGWIVFIVFFIVWEAVTGYAGPNQQLTHHLREVFDIAPVTWWIATGLWLWMGPHFLAPSLETWIHLVHK